MTDGSAKSPNFFQDNKSIKKAEKKIHNGAHKIKKFFYQTYLTLG